MPATRNLIGRDIGRYRVVSFLGGGGMGEVFDAIDSSLGRHVALKLLRSDAVADPKRLRRFEQEARTASALNHPHLVSIYEIGEHAGVHFIAMEKVDGSTLRQIFSSERLPFRRALDLMAQITDAIAAAHIAGIIHRDLKPENIMVSRSGYAKVLDFGLAKLQVETMLPIDASVSTLFKATESGAILGTIGYMSPEQAQGKPADARSDIFSLGCILYEAIAGKRAFHAASSIDTLHQIIHEEPQPLGHIAPNTPAEALRIVTKAMAKDPERRYQSAREIAIDLRDAAKAVDSVPRGTVAPLRAARPDGGARKVRWAIVGSVVLLATLLLVPAWRNWSRLRWARDAAIPQVAQLIENDRFIDAVHLARRVQSIVPNDPALRRLWPKMTMPVTINSAPPGANVFFATYNAPDSEWEFVGKTPLVDAPVPRGTFYRWRFEKKGYISAYRIAPSPRPLFVDRPTPLAVVLDRERTLPPHTVHIPAGLFRLNIPGLDDLEPVRLSDFLIDEFEVTNEEYKRFLAAGGYQKPEYWKQPFVKDGRPVSFETAMKEFVDSTGRAGPATWEVGDFPKGQAQYPVGGVSWYEAAAYAEFVGKRVPTIFHWAAAANVWTGAVVVPESNFADHGPWPVGSHRDMNAYGTYEMAGNLKEWCSNGAEPGKRYILGGAWNEPNYMFIEQDAQNAWSRSPTFGFRCVKLLAPNSVPRDAERPIWIPLRDFSKEKPVSDEVFNAYRSLYSYDQTPLNGTIESTESTESWTFQKISFDAAYGNDRVIAYLYLPKNARAPYQTVIYFPGASAVNTDISIGSTLGPSLEFIPKSGRALMLPIYKGTYERRDALKTWVPAKTAFYRDHVIAWAKDLGRSIDYLDTRPDIDHERLAFFGFSWGAQVGPLIAAVEPRLRTCIFLSGGLSLQHALPEADVFDFAPRMKQPVLILNARYDHLFPVKTSQIPMLQAIGTPEAEKKYIVYESGHVPPRIESIKESLAWLDQHLGVVRR